MTKDGQRRLWQAAACLLCAGANWRYGSALWGTEFEGGSFTGRLLDLQVIADMLFLLGLPLTFFFRRVAAGSILVASLLCLPLYLFFTAPGPIRNIVGGEWKGRLVANYTWDWWTIAGMLTVVIAAIISFRNLVNPAEEASASK